MSGRQLLKAGFLSAVCALTCRAADVDEIVRRGSATLKADWAAHEDYAFIETDEALKDGQWTAKTSQVVFIDGSDYYMAIGAEPAQIKAEAVRRAAETPEQRRKRMAVFRKARDANDALIRDFPDAFTFALLGEETIDGHKTYMLAATPKQRPGAASLAAKVLSGMKGTLWIDQESYHVVRVKGDVVTAVPVYGILAKVLPGTRVEFAMTPVSDAVWLLSEFSMNLRISKFFFFHSTRVTRSRFSDYRPNSEILAGFTGAAE